jgi:hypothetical protein
MDARRIPPRADATIAQTRDLVTLLGPGGPVPLLVFDAGYDPIALPVLVRIRSDRMWYADSDPAPPGRVGRPRRHGDGSPAPTHDLACS